MPPRPEHPAFDPLLQSVSLPVKTGLAITSDDAKVTFRCGHEVPCNLPESVILYSFRDRASMLPQQSQSHFAVTGTVYNKRAAVDRPPQAIGYFVIPLKDIEAGRFCVEQSVPIHGSATGAAVLRCLTSFPNQVRTYYHWSHLVQDDTSAPHALTTVSKSTVKSRLPVKDDSAPIPPKETFPQLQQLDTENCMEVVNSTPRRNHKGTLTPSPKSLRNSWTDPKLSDTIAHSLEFLKLEIHGVVVVAHHKYFLRVAIHKVHTV